MLVVDVGYVLGFFCVIFIIVIWSKMLEKGFYLLIIIMNIFIIILVVKLM